jgi:hypothetical protein
VINVHLFINLFCLQKEIHRYREEQRGADIQVQNASKDAGDTRGPELEARDVRGPEARDVRGPEARDETPV